MKVEATPTPPPSRGFDLNPATRSFDQSFDRVEDKSGLLQCLFGLSLNEAFHNIILYPSPLVKLPRSRVLTISWINFISSTPISVISIP